jgi:phosphoenolpyruvate-protein kinase (PTS system EI component)
MGRAFVYQDIWQRCQEPPDVMQEAAGGDKELPCLHLPAEPEAFLGRRGVRPLLSYPELLQTQLRALLRLAERHDLRILVPMVTLAEEMQQMRGLLQQAAGDVGAPRLPPWGP